MDAAANVGFSILVLTVCHLYILMFKFQLSNHDLGRIASRKSTQYLNGMNMLLMTLPGLAYVYYGDEIGMQHITVPCDQTQDPFGIEAGLVSTLFLS